MNRKQMKDEANETSKTDVKEQPKITAKDKFAFFLIAIAFCVIIAITSNRYTSTSSSSDDDTSSSSSTVDDSDWDYSALEDDTLNIDNYDYESQNCYNQLLDYLDLMGFSRNGLIHQLQYDEAINNALYVLEGNKYVI